MSRYSDGWTDGDVHIIKRLPKYKCSNCFAVTDNLNHYYRHINLFHKDENIKKI